MPNWILLPLNLVTRPWFALVSEGDWSRSAVFIDLFYSFFLLNKKETGAKYLATIGPMDKTRGFPLLYLAIDWHLTENNFSKVQALYYKEDYKKHY